jgi:uncharacterized repeat protein (TIGR04138 family)
MSESVDPFQELLRTDRRYKLEAYAFVFDALAYAHDVLGLGGPRPGATPSDEESEGRPEQHLTGQELCEAIRLLALDQFGLMAKTVFNSWGLHTTGDFGEIVFNLVRIQRMRKTEQDRREDFDDVWDFDAGLTQKFQISRPEPQEGTTDDG